MRPTLFMDVNERTPANDAPAAVSNATFSLEATSTTSPSYDAAALYMVSSISLVGDPG